MGNPVFIKDLAKKMVGLAGKNLNDVKIEYTGLRKGEKLKEEVFLGKKK